MTNSVNPSFDTLLRRHLGRQLRADGFKLVHSRTYERVVGPWTQEVWVQRFKKSSGFVMQLTMKARDVGGCLTQRYSEEGRNVVWGEDYWESLENAFFKAEHGYCARIRPLLDSLVAVDSPLETVSAAEFAALGAYAGPFHRGWRQLELFAKLRYRDGRLQEAKEFAERVLDESYLLERHMAGARSLIEQIDAGMPYRPQ